MEIETGSRSKIVIQRVEYKGKALIDIRRWFMDVTGKWKPTKKGISIPEEKFEEFYGCLVKLRGSDEDLHN